jgi:biotin carboxyl carrier protein
MRYHAILGGQERLIEVAAHGALYRVAIHDDPSESAEPRVLEVDAVHLQGFAVSIIVGTRSARCDIQPGKEGQLSVLVGETVYPLEILDERRLRLRRATGKFSLEGPQRVDAPMPGKVVRVLVKAGDEVQEGQGLVVVEAMKMENELKSPKAGKVTEIHAVEGAAVESGAKLVVVA